MIGVPRPRPFERCLQIDIHNQREVGLQPAAGDAVERQHRVHAQAAPAALVDQRGIGPAVREHDFPFGQRRPHQLVHGLRARCEIEQQFRGGAQLLVLRVQQNAADLHADGRARQAPHSPPQLAGRAQTLAQQAHLRALAAAVYAFKSDEQTIIASAPAPQRA